MKAKRVNKWVVVSTVLVIVLLCVITYFAVSEYKERKDAELLESFQKGAEYGYAIAISQLMGAAESCEPVDVFLGNETMQVISVNCIG